MYLFLCFCMLHNPIISKIIPLNANKVFNTATINLDVRVIVIKIELILCN